MATSMTWASFTAIPNGTQVFNHGYSECVALANLYHESVIGGSFVPVNSAYQWWTQFGSYATLRDNYTQSSTPTAGAIFVSKGGPYNNVDGHIGVVTSVNGNGTFNTMEQNAAYRYVWRYSRNMTAVYGFLIPKNNPAAPTPIYTTSKRNKMYLMMDTGGTGYLVTSDGTAGLASPQVYNLFFRLINSDQLKTPFSAQVSPFVPGTKDGYPERMLKAEVDIINANLKLLAASVKSGVAIDVEKTAQALSDALGKKFNPKVELDVTDLAEAFNKATPKIVDSMVKQMGERLAKQ